LLRSASAARFAVRAAIVRQDARKLASENPSMRSRQIRSSIARLSILQGDVAMMEESFKTGIGIYFYV
jgi:hypothetical protein